MNIIQKIKTCKNLSSCVRMINRNENYFQLIKDETFYLDENANIKERLFNIKNNITSKTLCPICKKHTIEWNDKFSIYKNTCFNKNCKKEYRYSHKDIEKEKERRNKISFNQKNKSEEEKNKIREKIKKTLIEKYGVDSYAKTQEFKEKMIEKIGCVSPFELKRTHEKSKKTLLQKYGCDHNFKIESVKEDVKRKNLEKYGHEKPLQNNDVKNKLIKTNIEKYGGNSPMCNNEIKQKALDTYNKNFVDDINNKKELLIRREKTMLQKYGVKYWIQDTDNFDNLVKSRKNTYKEYYINGKKIFLQGYENYALFEILLNKYDMNDIIIRKQDIEKEIGKIYYTIDEKKHRYFPDFYIKSINKIYEVKSEYTYISDEMINTIKKEACEIVNLKYEFIIINRNEYKKWLKEKNNKINYERI